MPPKDRTRRRVRPRQQRAHASVDAILTAAEQVLAEHGIAKATTNRIAARAGVNVALLYRYFSGKEAVVGALVERAAAATCMAVEAALTHNRDAPLRAALRAMLDALVYTPGVPPELHQQLVASIGITHRTQLVEGVRSRLAALFTEFLAHRHAELMPLHDAEATLFILEHAIESATHAVAFRRPAHLSAPRALDALVEMVAQSLLPRNPVMENAS